MLDQINRRIFLPRSPQEVWEYLTNPELIEQWLGKNDFKPIVGHKFRFVSPYGNDSLCEVLEMNPFTTLSYSWQKKSSKDQKPFTSVVTWTLVSKDHGTELQIVHHGFTEAQDFTAHENGWDFCLKQLEELSTID